MSAAISLGQLLQSADPELFLEPVRATLIDASFAEALRCNRVSLDSEHVLGIDEDWQRLVAPLRLLQPQAVFVICTGTMQQTDTLKLILKAANIVPRRVCLLLSSAVGQLVGSAEVADFFSLKFLPFQVSIAYLPIYLNAIVKSEATNLEAHIFSSHLCRDAYQPLLRKAEAEAERGNAKSIADRLVPVARKKLKLLTHELAGALLSLG